MAEMPTITTVTPALRAAKFAHLNEVCAKKIWLLVLKISGQRIGTDCPWQIEFVETSAAADLVCVP